jgi:hypothetical protein
LTVVQEPKLTCPEWIGTEYTLKRSRLARLLYWAPLRAAKEIWSQSQPGFSSEIATREVRSTKGSLLDEISHELGDLVRSCIKREVTAVDDMDLGIRHIATISLGLGGVKGEFILAPDHQ